MRRIGVISLAIVLALLLPLQSLTSTANAQSLLLTKTWGGAGYDYGYGVAVDGSGNIYVTGWTLSFGAGSEDIVLLKYDSSGGLVWQKTWGGTSTDYGLGVAVDGSGNIYVTGETYSFGAGGDVVLLKYDSSGGLTWQKTWGGAGYDYGLGVAVDSSGDIYVAGYTYSFGAGSVDVVLLKYDSSGGLVWQKTWGGTNLDEGYGVAVVKGDIYVTGTTASFGAGSYDVVLLKYDSSGGLVWQKTWGGTYYDHGLGVAVDSSSGDIYVTGYTYSFGAGGYDVVLLKYSGVLVWQKTWGGTNDDKGFGVTTHAGYVYFTGYVSESARTLNAVSATVTTPSGTVGSLGNSTLGTPTYTPGTPTFTPGTPSGSETYAGGGDVFLLKFSTRTVVGELAGFTSSPTNSTLLVVGDLALNPTGHTKPSGVGYQQGRDTTPLGFVYGMMENVQDTMFDTNAAINATDGRPLSSISQTLIFAIGGPGINAVTHYYENTSNTTDQAPVKFGYNSTHFWWELTGKAVKVYTFLQSETAVPPGSSDVFVIQILHDADGRAVVLMYGTRYTGTWAAAVYFKFVVYANIASYTDSYYVVRWTDVNSDFTPNIGDTFTILAQGTP